ncbi:MAG TPA: methylated-DNA--[protein]-cysteine S-methyltransferase [Saprospiraceae bacterium]|nr:methylated-DNA--[protein]-cysteine S-methyltransferase [Saprospiraceae bacterium]HND90019.1 methylated-DNA--[protein]-cysteine S-methyltransferase [Saprospiraceae bacterium]
MSAKTAFIAFTDSPLGELEIHAVGDDLTGVFFAKTEFRPRSPAIASAGPLPAPIEVCQQQLQEYFAGQRQVFDLPLLMQGTDFQREIWRLLLQIPYGYTLSYLELSRRYGDEKAIRAVGAANGANPLSIVVPCHRVIGAEGKLVGYGGDVWRKEWLLRHEAQHAGVATGRLF